MFKVLDKVCKPQRATKFSACVDLFAKEDVVIGAGETVKVPLGVCIDEEKLRELVLDEVYPYSFSHNFTKDETKKTEDLILYDFKSKHYLELHPSDSLSLKGLICNIGIIDMDYKDEICLIVHNPFTSDSVDLVTKTTVLGKELMDKDFPREAIEEAQKDLIKTIGVNKLRYTIKKGQKIAQIMLKEHKTGLFGIESDVERVGGFESSGE